MTIQEAIMSDIKTERRAQDMKWGVQTHEPEKWMTILMEEVGEAAKAVLEHDAKNYYAEMVQIAAVCVVALECMGREPDERGDD